VRLVQEREDKFEVDPDWVLPQVMSLVPDGGRVDQERCAGSRTPPSTRQVLVCGCLGSHYGAGSRARRQAGR
jgi:hypothetical protein